MNVQARRVSSVFVMYPSLFFVGLLLFSALIYRRADLAVLALLVLCLVAGLKAWGRASPRGIAFRLSVDKARLFAGDGLTISAWGQNGKLLPVWLEAAVSAKNGRTQEKFLRASASLLWRQGARFSWELPGLKRGIAVIGPAMTATADLFGFFPAEKTQGDAIQVVVYPRLVPLKEFRLPKRDFFGTPGGRSPVNDPVYILGTTDYHPGRPARFIHWKATARHGRLQEKIFEPTRQAKALILLDTERFFTESADETFERTIEVAASVAARLDREGCAVGLLTNGHVTGGSPFVPVSRGPGQLSAVLEALARLDMEPACRMADLVYRIEVPWGATCLYFASEEDDAARAVLASLARKKLGRLFFTAEAALQLVARAESTQQRRTA